MQEYFSLYRPRNAVPPIVWALIGSAISSTKFGLSVSLAGCLVSIVLINFYATAQNDLNDYLIDKKSGRKNAITLGRVNLKRYELIANLLAFIAVIIAALTSGLMMVLIIMLYIFASVLYNQKPFYLSRKPILSIIILATCFSALPLTAGYISQSVKLLDLDLVPLILGGFLFRYSISILKDYKDYTGDLRFKKITYLVRYGAKSTKNASILSFCVGVSILIGYVLILSKLTFAVGALLIGLALLLFSERIKLSNMRKKFELNNLIFHRILFFSLIFEISIFTCLYIY